MHRFATDAPIDVAEFRARLRKMTVAELLKYGNLDAIYAHRKLIFGNRLARLSLFN
jgi:hypothetical protein